MTTDRISRGLDDSWPAITTERVEWHGAVDPAASRRAALRARGPYDAAVPASIAGRQIPSLGRDATLAAEDAVVELTRFDAEVGAVTAPFSAILLRSESAASSEIEQLTASARSIALAELGRPAGVNSRSIVGNVRAMVAAIDLADDLDPASIIAMQTELLGEERPELTGGWRTVPVWIGGGYSGTPHTAAFVPPRHERVDALMHDLVEFARRADLPALPQIAIAHAQFETVHPFPDGNGRTGRALVQSMLRRLGIARSVTVPVSAGLLQDPREYFGALTAYREGDVVPIVMSFARASSVAVVSGRRLVDDLQRIRAGWDDHASGRRGSAGRRLLDVLVRQPVVDAASASSALGISARNAQNGLDRLVEDGILRPVGTARRDRAYEATEVLIALDAFAARARRRGLD